MYLNYKHFLNSFFQFLRSAKRNSSPSVSRILSFSPKRKRQSSIWIPRCREIHATYPNAGPAKRGSLHGPRSSEDGTPIWSCSGWGLQGQAVSSLPVRSYRTISPLPTWSRQNRDTWRRYLFCCTFRRLSTPGRYPAPSPMEFGLSSPARGRGDCPMGM